MSNLAHANALSGVRVWSDANNTRLVIDMSAKPTYSFFSLKNPHRLVVDLSNTQLKTNLKSIDLHGPLVKKLRASTPKSKHDFRLVIELAASATPNVFALGPKGRLGHRLVIDLPQKAGSSPSPASKPKAVPATPPKPKPTPIPSGSRDIIIAIDAGHGGKDPGAIGPKNVYEKGITLAIAKRMARLINQEKGLKAVLTRTGDYYITLNQRSQIARKNKADFLVSVHADGFTSPKPSGASVWVVSAGRAKSEVGRHLEDHETQSQLLGGVGDVLEGMGDDEYLNFALVDMIKDDSMKISHGVATEMLQHLGRITKLHKSKPEHASLAVLKSPDIPSVLVEAGFITNPREEQLLLKGNHQEKIAKAVVEGIRAYFREDPPEDSYYARLKGQRQHTVKRGESLSVLAQRYSVDVSVIKNANRLSSNTLQVGQVLTIPSR